MNQLVFKSGNNALTTSLLVAEKFCKNHRDVLESIRNLIMSAENSAVLRMFCESTYLNSQNKEQPMYVMNRDGFTLLVMGFTGKDALQFKIDYINAFNNMEETIRRGNFQVPTSFREALLLAADLQGKIEEKEKQIEQKDNQIAVLEKESEYTRVILQNKGTTLVTQIAQDYGMSAMKLNAKLRDFGIQHKVRRQWILYGKYLNKGYVHSSSTPIVHKDGREDISLTTEWTQRGRLFLYNILKSNGILPLIEI